MRDLSITPIERNTFECVCCNFSARYMLHLGRKDKGNFDTMNLCLVCLRVLHSRLHSMYLTLDII